MVRVRDRRCERYSDRQHNVGQQRAVAVWCEENTFDNPASFQTLDSHDTLRNSELRPPRRPPRRSRGAYSSRSLSRVTLGQSPGRSCGADAVVGGAPCGEGARASCLRPRVCLSMHTQRAAPPIDSGRAMGCPAHRAADLLPADPETAQDEHITLPGRARQAADQIPRQGAGARHVADRRGGRPGSFGGLAHILPDHGTTQSRKGGSRRRPRHGRRQGHGGGRLGRLRGARRCTWCRCSCGCCSSGCCSWWCERERQRSGAPPTQLPVPVHWRCRAALACWHPTSAHAHTQLTRDSPPAYPQAHRWLAIVHSQVPHSTGSAGLSLPQAGGAVFAGTGRKRPAAAMAAAVPASGAVARTTPAAAAPPTAAPGAASARGATSAAGPSATGPVRHPPSCRFPCTGAAAGQPWLAGTPPVHTHTHTHSLPATHRQLTPRLTRPGLLLCTRRFLTAQDPRGPRCRRLGVPCLLVPSHLSA